MLSNFSPCFFRKTLDCILVSNSRHFFFEKIPMISCFSNSRHPLWETTSENLSHRFEVISLRGQALILLSKFILFGETSDDKRRAARRSYFRVLAGFRFSPLSGVTHVTGRSGWWPPILCLYGGRSNFNRNKRSQLIHIMDASWTSSWMAHAIKCYLVPSFWCPTLWKASAEIGGQTKEWLIATISTCTLSMELKPIKALTHAFRLLPITNWSLRLLTFLLAPDDKRVLFVF